MKLRPSSSLRYDAVGVLERWDETCELFDARAPLVEPWCVALARRAEDHGAGAWRARARDELARARGDRAVRAEVSGDLELYHGTVVPLFDEMRRRAGLGAGR